MVRTPRLQETRLEAQRTSAVYRGRLRRGLALFLSWCLAWGQVDTPPWQDETAMDQLLCNFVNWCKEGRVEFWLAKHAVLSVQTKWRTLRRRIPRAWDCLRSWGGMRSWGNRVPLSERLLKFLFAVCLSWGLEGGREAGYYICFAVLIRVGFSGFSVQPN